MRSTPLVALWNDYWQKRAQEKKEKEQEEMKKKVKDEEKKQEKSSKNTYIANQFKTEHLHKLLNGDTSLETLEKIRDEAAKIDKELPASKFWLGLSLAAITSKCDPNSNAIHNFIHSTNEGLSNLHRLSKRAKQKDNKEKGLKFKDEKRSRLNYTPAANTVDHERCILLAELDKRLVARWEEKDLNKGSLIINSLARLQALFCENDFLNSEGQEYTEFRWLIAQMRLNTTAIGRDINAFRGVCFVSQTSWPGSSKSNLRHLIDRMSDYQLLHETGNSELDLEPVSSGEENEVNGDEIAPVGLSKHYKVIRTFMASEEEDQKNPANEADPIQEFMDSQASCIYRSGTVEQYLQMVINKGTLVIPSDQPTAQKDLKFSKHMPTVWASLQAVLQSNQNPNVREGLEVIRLMVDRVLYEQEQEQNDNKREKLIAKLIHNTQLSAGYNNFAARSGLEDWIQPIKRTKQHQTPLQVRSETFKTLRRKNIHALALLPPPSTEKKYECIENRSNDGPEIVEKRQHLKRINDQIAELDFFGRLASDRSKDKKVQLQRLNEVVNALQPGDFGDPEKLSQVGYQIMDLIEGGGDNDSIRRAESVKKFSPLSLRSFFRKQTTTSQIINDTLLWVCEKETTAERKRRSSKK